MFVHLISLSAWSYIHIYRTNSLAVNVTYHDNNLCVTWYQVQQMFAVYTHSMVVFLASINTQHPKLQSWNDIRIKIVKLTCAITIVLNSSSTSTQNLFFPSNWDPYCPNYAPHIQVTWFEISHCKFFYRNWIINPITHPPICSTRVCLSVWQLKWL
jgi:hypothetical protein